MSFRAEQEAAAEAALPRWGEPGSDVTASLGGTHELSRFVGRWGAADVGEWVVLRDRAGGGAILDMARVRTAKVCCRADGALLIRIEGSSDARLIIVSPDLAGFRDVGVDAAPRPIAELQGAVASAAWELGADGGPRHPRDAYLERDFSAEGTVLVEYGIEPQRMSHETRVPRIIDVGTGETLLAMPDSLHDGSVRWLDGEKAQLSIRHYGGGHADLFLDLAARTFAHHGSDQPRPLNQAKQEIARQIARARAPSAAKEKGRQGPVWGVILLIILVGIIMAVGAVA